MTDGEAVEERPAEGAGRKPLHEAADPAAVAW